MEQVKDLENTEIPEINFDEFEATCYDQWKEQAIIALKGADFDKSMFTKTYEGITLNPIYLPEDLEKLTHPQTYPAQASNLRGAHASGYISKPWIIAQQCDAKSLAEANAVLKRELLKGTTAVSFVLDTASRKGIDAPEALDVEFADKGVSVSTLADLEVILKDINLVQQDLALYAGASNIALLAAIAAFAEKQGFDTHKLTGAVAADPIGELASSGTLARSLDEYYDEMAHSIAWAEEHAPNLKTVIIDTDVYHNAGGNDVQEIGYAMSTAVTYIKAMLLRGISIEAFCKHVRFHFSIGANFFMEIAKLRSVKMIWSQIVQSFAGSKAAEKIDLFVSTSTFCQTAYDPYVNVLRAATQSFSAVIGGIDGMFIKPFDHVIRPSDEFSRRIARNVQIMLQHEFNLIQPIDPAGGSWYLEPLTNQLTEKAWAKFQELEAQGGILEALQTSKVHSDLTSILADRFKKLAMRSDRAVGNNMYPNMTEVPLTVEPVNYPELKAQRITSLEVNAKNRDNAMAQALLKEISDCDASEVGTLVTLAIKAMLVGATAGELNQALTGSNHKQPTVEAIAAHRWTENYEEMRKRTETFKAKTGENYTIFLSNMGPIPQHKARAEFVTSFMQVAAFDVIGNDGFPTVDEAVQAVLASKADATIICSTDATYPDLAPELTRKLKAANSKIKVFLAGAPSKELKELCDAAGMDDYISVRSNCYETLVRMQKERGMF